jgi:hypothetical protein
MRDKRDLDSITMVIGPRVEIPPDLGVPTIVDFDSFTMVGRKIDMSSEYKKSQFSSPIDPRDKDNFSINIIRDYNDSLAKLKADDSLSTDKFGHQFINLKARLQRKKDQGKLEDVKLIELIMAEEARTTSDINFPSFTRNQLMFAFLVLLLILIVVFMDAASSYANTIYEKVSSMF